MKEEMCVDSVPKIITSCPKCGNQHELYIIDRLRIINGLYPKWCENCKLPYVVDVEVEVKCMAETYKCVLKGSKK